MTSMTQTISSDPLIRAAGGFAIVSGIISAIGVVFLITMFALFAASLTALGQTFGMLNDICVALQYLLTLPIALALYRLLLPSHATLMRLATGVGLVAMIGVILLQLALIFKVLTFEQQVVWVTPVMLLGVGSWLMITGWVAQSTGKLPNGAWISALAVPYMGFPVWAFWLGRQLLRL